MDSEIVESLDVTDTTDAARSFNWAVDSAIRSETGSILGESPVHSFASLVDSAIRSSSATEADLGSSPVHVFAMAEHKAELKPATNNFPGLLFTLAELEAATNNFSHDNMIGYKVYRGKLVDGREVSIKIIKFRGDSFRETGYILGESRVRSFASLVDSAIRSSRSSEADMGTPPSPVHAFASAVDIRTVAARLFTLAEHKVATNNFSFHNKIVAGGLGGVVYRGKLIDDREVAIKRGKTWSNSIGKSEFALFSRLHHNNLVGLVGFCEEKDVRLLLYEYMKNGGLYHHLHGKKGSSVLNSWKMRIKIAFDVSQGIQYLHNFASIIHGDIKSSNILFDATWTARVSGFDLSLMSPEPDRDHRPMKAAGTVGYIDLNVLTAKSDVYGLGVVLLEILTGRRAIFKYAEDHRGTPFKSVVDFAVPAILAGELVKILDPRVGPPNVNEAEAVEFVAYTAIHCVNFKGKDRPTTADIVANLERALAICESSHI